MKKGLMILIVICICFFKSGVKASYEEYKIGDLVKYNDIGFVVIENSDSNDEYVTLLKGEPLTVDEVNKYGKGHINNYTSSPGVVEEYLGYGTIAYYSSSTCGYINGTWVETGCKSDYNMSDIKYVVDAWALDNIKAIDLKTNDQNLSVRLLTFNELIKNLGYSYKNQSGSIIKANKNVYSWLMLNSGYWTMEPYYLEGYVREYESLWGIRYGDLIGHFPSTTAMVRPVVVLKKSSIIKDELYAIDINNSESSKYKIYNQGEKINYNGIDFYIVKNSDGNTASVTLLKAEPLTVDEVKKYGEGHINNYFSKDDVAQKEVDNVNGYGGVAYYTSENCIYINYQWITEGCTNDYNKSDIKYIVDAWSNAKVNQQDLVKDKYGYKSRLIKKEEISGYGYEYLESNYFKTYKTPDWISNYTYDYWTMDASDKNRRLFYVDYIGDILTIDVQVGNYLHTPVIRPVINLSKEAIGGVLKENVDESDKEVNDSDNIISNDNNNNDDDTKDNVINQIISVPDTLKSMNVKAIIFGIILITSGIVGFIFVKKKRNTK